VLRSGESHRRRVGGFVTRRRRLALVLDGRPPIDVCALALMRAGCDEIRYRRGEIRGRVPGRPGAVVALRLGPSDGRFTPATLTARRAGPGRGISSRGLADAVVHELEVLEVLEPPRAARSVRDQRSAIVPPVRWRS
jgi:hypothetical protein